MELSKTEFRRLVSIVNRAKIECLRKRYALALPFLEQASELFLPPLEDWVGAEYLCILTGNVYFELNKYDIARSYYLKSKQCIDKAQLIDTDFRIAKTYYEEGNYAEAKKIFNSIYSYSGKKPFLKEQAKYYRLVTNSSNLIIKNNV